MTLKQMKRKQLAEERKKIESVLHPCPKIGEADILHEHKGKVIRFNAWDKDAPINSRVLEVDRMTVLFREDFYSLYKKELVWLTERTTK